MSVLDVRSPIPLYHQISREISRRISDGDYAEGRLPPEEQLSIEFEVSRGTVRQAIGELVALRLVTRRRGAGTHVARAAQHLLGQRFSGSLVDLMNETKRAGVAEVEVENSAAIPGRIAEMLRLSPPIGTVVRRTRTMDGSPFSFTINFLPPRIGRLLTVRELRHEPLMWLLQSKGVALRGATQSIRAELADVEVSRRLSVALGSPVLFVERVVTGAHDTRVELVQSWYRGDRYEFTVTLDFRQSATGRLPANLA